MDNYLLLEDYIASEAGGSINLTQYLTKAEAEDKYAPKNIIETVYPVGAIYLSVNEISPDILFGFSQWERIQDRFLFGASSVYPAGEEGGEVTHTLTSNEIPAHSHTYDRGQLWRTESDPTSGKDDVYGANNKTLDAYAGTTSVVGNGQPHNNMPPYLSVYMWKRIG